MVYFSSETIVIKFNQRHIGVTFQMIINLQTAIPQSWKFGPDLFCDANSKRCDEVNEVEERSIFWYARHLQTKFYD